MKILQFVTQMEAAGAQGRAINLQTELNRRGHSVETVFLYIKRPAFVGIDGVSSLFNRPIRIWEVPLLFFRIWKKVRDSKPDIVMPYTHWSNVIVGIVSFCAGYNVIANQTNPPNKEPKLAHYLDCLWGWMGIYKANIANSKTTYQVMAQRISSRYKQRLRLVRLGVFMPENSQPKGEIRRRNQVPDEASLLLHVGRLAKQKNLPPLLQAMALLPSNIHLACVGDGELKDELHQLANSLNLGERMHWVGEKSRSEVTGLLKAADLFVFPSLFEGFGLAPVEAAAVGLPLLVSDIPTFHEVMALPDGRLAAEMVPPSDAGAIAYNIQRILGNSDLLEDLKSRSRVLAEKYSLKNMADDYERCIEEFV